MNNFSNREYPYNLPYYRYYPNNNLNYNRINKNNFNNRDLSHSKEAPKSGASPLIEFLGFQLYLDDLIILGILFFLYQEKVDDYMLYIILFLLLLS